MFPLGSTPSKRPKRRVESYRILYAHILHALSLPGHPLRVTEKATHGEQVGLYSWHSRTGTSITINIVPKCEVCPRDHGKVVESLRGQRIPDDSSIFTAEAKAIDLALDFISTCDANNKFIIFSDSLSVLKAMNHTSSKNPQIQKLLEKCHELLAYKEIALCWIPSHIGIQGNEMVDKQAKTSLSLEPTSFKIPFSNFKPSINISWKNSKLHGITALVINFLTSNQLLVNINQLFETLEEKK